jgi:hypothetical protein
LPLDRLYVDTDSVEGDEPAALTMTEYVALALCEALSAAWRVNVDVAAAVGVPDITPLLRVSPAGRVPLDNDHV